MSKCSHENEPLKINMNGKIIVICPDCGAILKYNLSFNELINLFIH